MIRLEIWVFSWMGPLGFWETVATSQRAYSALCNVRPETMSVQKKSLFCLGPAPVGLSGGKKKKNLLSGLCSRAQVAWKKWTWQLPSRQQEGWPRVPEQSRKQSSSTGWSRSEGDRVGILTAGLSWCLEKPSWTAAVNH